MSPPAPRRRLDPRSTPWWLLALLPALSFAWPIFDILSFYPAWLAVPVAAWAGHRHGWRGVEAVAVGGLLLPVGIAWRWGRLPDDLDVYPTVRNASAALSVLLVLRIVLG